MKALAVAILVGLLAPAAHGAVKMDPVEYKQGDTTLKGVIAYDDAVTGKRPGIIVVHEWWGLNDYARTRARMLAEAGYVAFAIDMFGGGKTTEHPKEAGEWSGALAKNHDVTVARFTAAYDLLRKNEHVDAARIAAIGYCMGGSVVLGMALDGVDLRGVASFHGGPPDQLGKGPIKASILMCYGASDEFISQESVDNFGKILTGAGADWEFIAYGGAKHSFTNPSADTHGIPNLAYNEKADHRSWATLLDFLAEVLK